MNIPGIGASNPREREKTMQEYRKTIQAADDGDYHHVVMGDGRSSLSRYAFPSLPAANLFAVNNQRAGRGVLIEDPNGDYHQPDPEAVPVVRWTVAFIDLDGDTITIEQQPARTANEAVDMVDAGYGHLRDSEWYFVRQFATLDGGQRLYRARVSA